MKNNESGSTIEAESLGTSENPENSLCILTDVVPFKLTLNVIQVIFDFLPVQTMFEFHLVNKRINNKYWEYLSSNLVDSEFSLKDISPSKLSIMNLSSDTLLSIIKATRQHLVLSKLASAAITQLSKSGFNFYKIDLSGISISNADLSHSRLQYINFFKANLSNVNFVRSYISDCNFKNSSLQNAEFGCRVLSSHLHTITTLVLSHNHKLLVSTGYDKLIKIWKIPEFTLEKTLKNCHTSAITALCLSGDNSILISGAENIKIWDLRTFTSRTIDAHNKKVTSLSMSLGNGIFVSSSFDSTIKIWKTENGKVKKTIKVDSPVNSVMMDEEGKVLVAGCKSGEVGIWDIKGKTLASNRLSTCGVQCVFIDKKYIVTGSYNGAVGLRDRGNQLIREYFGHCDAINSVKIQGSYIYSAGGEMDCSIRKWELISSACIDVIAGHSLSINSMVILNDFVISAGQGKTIRIDKSMNQDVIADWIECILIAEDNKRVIAGYVQGKVRIWLEAQVVQEFKCPSRVMSLAANQDVIAAGCWDMVIYIKGTININLVGHTDGINTLHFLNEYLFSGASDGSVRIWIWAESLCINTLTENNGYVHRVLANSNYAVATTGCSMTKIVIWDLESDTQTYLYSRRGRVKAVAINDHHFAIGGSETSVIDIFTYQGILIRSFTNHTAAITELIFYLDYLISSSDDKTIYIWDWMNNVIISKYSGFAACKLSVSNNYFYACENKGNSLQFYELQLDKDTLEGKLLWRTLNLFECRNSNFRAVKGLTREEEEDLENFTVNSKECMQMSF